jgi:hypothetical protein
MDLICEAVGRAMSPGTRRARRIRSLVRPSRWVLPVTDHFYRVDHLWRVIPFDAPANNDYVDLTRGRAPRSRSVLDRRAAGHERPED